MSRDSLSFLAMALCCLGSLAVVFLACASTFRRLRGFSTMVEAKKSGWDAFISRTGLQWELKTAAYNPVMDRLFGSDVADKTGRVIGTYRGYPVVVSSQTRHQYSQDVMVIGQSYYTEFRLTIRNPAGVSLKVWKKDDRLTFEPQDRGEYLLEVAHSFGRLEQVPSSFLINIQQQELYYIQPGVEEGADRLYNILEILCDLADAVGSCRS
jgi:hypothetical protein